MAAIFPRVRKISNILAALAVAFDAMAQQTITLQPNSSQAVSASGKFLNVISCTDTFKVEADNGGQNVAVAGSQFSAERPFRRLTFQETQGVANKITFDVSDSPSPGRTTTVSIGAATFGKNGAWYDFGTASGLGQGKFTFVGTSAVTGQTRKSITICNLGFTVQGGSSSTALIVGFIGGQTTQPAFAVWPQTSLTIETSDDLILWSMNQNLSGQPTHLMGTVYEIAYTQTLQTDQ